MTIDHRPGAHLQTLSLRPELTVGEWLGIGRRLADISTGSAWALGDWLLYGQRSYGRQYKAALEATGFEYQTLRNYAWVARRFPPTRRRERLSFQHHAEVASLPEPEQDLYLRRAELNSWSRNELRRRVSELRCVGLDRRRAVTISVEVTSIHERRWGEAAARSQRLLAEWIVDALDRAADDVLG